MKNKTLILLSALVFLSASDMAMAKQSKIALVIGNKSYKDIPLKNSVNDAQDMKTALEKAGFTVIYAADANQKKMDEAREKFVDALALNKDAIGLFYYSGHGVQADGINYLIPIDAKIKSKVDLKYNAYDVNYFLDEMTAAENLVNIVILDACRNNPFKSVRAIGGGLTSTDAPDSAQGSLIAYATAPNSVADDNQKGRNGLYTKYLKQYLFTPGLTIENALKKVGAAVKKENPDQIPWQSNSLTEDICLSGCNASSVVTPTPAVTPVITTPVVKPVIVPTISTINVLPASIIQGDSLTFSANLSDVLPSGYSVKVDYGNGLFSMTSNGKNYSFNATPASSAAYSIGVYDAKNLLKGTKQTGNFSVSAPKPVNVSPTLNLISGDKTATVGIPYTIKFSANDNDGNLSAILVSNWGDGASSDPRSATDGETLSFSHTFTAAGSYTFNATAYDSEDANSNIISQNVTVSKPAPVVVTPAPVVTKKTGYTKISNSGAALSDSAKLGSGSNEWACTKDNKTGLIWEVKTDDNGLRDKDWYYSWYEPDASKNGGFEGYKNYYPNGCKGSECDTFAYTNAVNKQSLCGATDWRLPTKGELEGLVYCSDGKTTTLGKDESGWICSSNKDWNLTTTSPTINATYFPDIKDNYWFWSSSPYADSSGSAWVVLFVNGLSDSNYKFNFSNVRLVRG